MNGRRFSWVLALLLVATRAVAVDWFGDPIISPLPGVPTTASVGNLDAVPGLDVAVGSGGAEIWILSGDGTGGFALATTLSSPSASTYVEVGDFDGDGLDDIAAADYQAGPGIRVLLGDGGGGFQESMIADSDLVLYRFVAHDVDGDGRDDLVAAGGGASKCTGGRRAALPRRRVSRRRNSESALGPATPSPSWPTPTVTRTWMS